MLSLELTMIVNIIDLLTHYIVSDSSLIIGIMMSQAAIVFSTFFHPYKRPRSGPYAMSTKDSTANYHARKC